MAIQCLLVLNRLSTGAAAQDLPANVLISGNGKGESHELEVLLLGA